MTIDAKGFELHPWQQDAVEAWARGTGGAPYRGTLEIVTGGGKTLIALACLARAASEAPDLRAAVVVPTEALARQWRENIVERTTLTVDEVGLLGAGGKSTFAEARVIVAVINTASTRLPELAASAQPCMLIVDECHRAGAPKYSKVLRTPARFRLGLSATPDREELDEDGEPLEYDEQAVGRSLGGVVFRFGLRDARVEGWLPEFELHHHGLALSPEERQRYDLVSRRVDEAAEELRAMGVETSRARSVAGRADETGEAARRWVQFTANRKDLLYRAAERERVAGLLVARAFADGGSHRVILFHERVDEAVGLHGVLASKVPEVRVALEHSRLPDRRRRDALAAFASGDAPVLVSVKSLVEGIDVPSADVGISVASTSSVRQRVQALGRVLRRAVDAAGEAKRSTMHLLYVSDTVDESIYGKADWTDLTGSEANHYWRWAHGEDSPERVEEPPRKPLPTEEQIWQQLGGKVPTEPVKWPGVVLGQEYTVDTRGVVHNSAGVQIMNPQEVGDMVARARGQEGGRFRVTPAHRLVLVWRPGDEGAFVLAGRLGAPFEVVDDSDLAPDEASMLKPGHAYRGPGDKKGGTYKVSQRGGGLIERRVKGGAEVAQTAGPGTLECNAAAVLSAWEALDRSFSRFFVNTAGHAWAESPTGRIFIASVNGGFAWPSSEGVEG